MTDDDLLQEYPKYLKLKKNIDALKLKIAGSDILNEFDIKKLAFFEKQYLRRPVLLRCSVN